MLGIDLQVLGRGVLALPKIERAYFKLRTGFRKRNVGRKRTGNGRIVKGDFRQALRLPPSTVTGLWCLQFLPIILSQPLPNKSDGARHCRLLSGGIALQRPPPLRRLIHVSRSANVSLL